MVISLERGADLHMAKLMPLPHTISCISKIQIGFTFLVPAHLVIPEKGQLNVCVCVCVRACVLTYHISHGTGSHFVTQRPSDPGIQRPGDPVDPVTLFYNELQMSTYV